MKAEKQRESGDEGSFRTYLPYKIKMTGRQVGDDTSTVERGSYE